MAQFYSLSETISPTLAWGFLGTDETLKIKCTAFRVHIHTSSGSGYIYTHTSVVSLIYSVVVAQ